MEPDRIDRLVTTIRDTCTSPITVIGGSDEAERLRAAFTERTDQPRAGEPPATVVETTGTTAGLAAAFAQVADLGTVVLAGPVPVEAVVLDLHGDVHVRGLTIIGVDPAST